MFRPNRALSKYCGPKCCYADKPKKGKDRKCQNKSCTKTYYAPMSRASSKYCSRECSNESIPRAEKTQFSCKQCGESYELYTSYSTIRQTKFCSVKCRGESAKDKYKKARTDNSKYPKKVAKFKKWTWKHFSDYVRERDNWTCFTCGKYDKSPAMHGGHFISRVRAATLFDEINVHAQCYGCNIGKKGNAGEYAYRIIQKYGQEAFDDLVERSRQTHKFTHEELESIYQNAKTKLKELQSKN